MISLILVFLAAICNAIMDNLTHHWYMSVFNNVKLDLKFWNSELSWIVRSLEYTNYKLDAWHIFKSSMIILLALAIVFYSPMVNWFVYLILIGVLLNFSFNFGYNQYINKK